MEEVETTYKATYLMYIERCRGLFLETKNPIYAWQAFENARRMKYPIPEEVLDYIVDVAHDIVKVAQDPPRPAQRPVAIAKALKLRKKGRGQGSPFTEYQTRLQARELALNVVGSEFYDPNLLDYAFDDVAEKSEVSKSTVRRNFLTHKESWHQTAKELIESNAITYGPDGKPQIRTIGTAADMKEACEILKEIERIQTPA